MKDVNEFYSYYTDEILPLVVKDWDSCRNIFRVYSGIFAIIFVFVFFISIYFQTVWPLIFLCVCGGFFYFMRRNKPIYEDLRPKIIRKIVDFIGDGFSYRAWDSLAAGNIRNLGIFNASLPKSFRVSDVITGNFSGGPFRIEFIIAKIIGTDKFEMKAIYAFFAVTAAVFVIELVPFLREWLYYIFGLTDYGLQVLYSIFMIILMLPVTFSALKKRYDLSDFNTNGAAFTGTLVTCDFNKDFKSSTVVVPQGGKRSDIFRLTTPYGAMERVDLENLRFMETFNVYSGSQQEARYLLTPVFMERLMAVSENLGGDVAFYFSGSELFFWLNKNVLAGVEIFQKEDNFIKAAELYVHLSDIVDSLSDLGLDVRIWTKE